MLKKSYGIENVTENLFHPLSPLYSSINFTKYKKNTDELLKYIVDNNIKTILGGGDIVAAATAAGYKEKVYHASTGGGATLEYLEGKTLPGIESLK